MSRNRWSETVPTNSWVRVGGEDSKDHSKDLEEGVYRANVGTSRQNLSDFLTYAKLFYTQAVLVGQGFCV